MPTAKRIQYRYTPTGQRSSLIDPDGGRFTYSYDSVKRLTQVINPQGERTSYTYDAAGRRTVKKLANGSRTSFTYNAASRITSVAHLKSDTSVQASFSYQYDKAGNRTSLSEADGSRTSWSYDAAYQLTGEHRTGSNAYRNTYVYDNRGNSTLKNLDGARTTSTYDAANQLQWSQDASGRTTYTFDADGNQQVVLSPSGDRVTNVWDYENKLVGVQHPAGSRETMAYDPDGKRVMLEESATTTKYVWDEQNYLQETDAGDVTQVTYTNEPRTYGNLISQRKSGASHYYLFDALGSTRLVTDASENVSESLLYDAWGNLIGSSPTMVVPFRWVGELGYLFVPVTSDYYVRERIYGPKIGRWISQDPLGFVDRFDNLFEYSANQIVDLIDPSGAQPQLPDPPGHVDLGGPGVDYVPAYLIANPAFFDNSPGLHSCLQVTTCAKCVDGWVVEGETYSIEIQAFWGYFDLDLNPPPPFGADPNLGWNPDWRVGSGPAQFGMEWYSRRRGRFVHFPPLPRWRRVRNTFAWGAWVIPGGRCAGEFRRPIGTSLITDILGPPDFPIGDFIGPIQQDPVHQIVEDRCRLAECLVEAATDVGSEATALNVGYDILRRNCNSYVGTILRRCGISIPSDEMHRFGPRWGAPGWDNDFVLGPHILPEVDNDR